MNKLKIITGTGILAIKQVEEVMRLLPNVSFEIVEIQINSDKQKEISQYTPADFSSLILLEANLAGEADLAIYPAKDLPYPLPASLEVTALIATPDQSGSLIYNDARKPSDAPAQALIEAITNPLQGQLAVIARKGNINLKDLFSPLDCRSNYGKVTIAGFGPGDPELLTVKAYRALENADIIFYDCLLDKTYLDNFKGEKISSGKRKDNHLKEQDEINELLYQAAISGKQVVRIKGGDPLIFGRGGEEFFYLKKRFIDVEIIPGITSALAAAAIAGIPLTQRNISSSVAFGTGHPVSSIHIPDTDTIVFYMPASNLHLILNKLIEAGRSEDTPVALIENISLPLQRIITGTLKELLLKPYTYHSPLLIIVGDTVKLNYVI